MSEQFCVISFGDTKWSIGKRKDDGAYAPMLCGEIVALLNTPTPPSTGIVWRKPGEPGRVSGKRYLVLISGGHHADWSWNEKDTGDGWGSNAVTAWADLPSPPSWANWGAA